MRNLTLAMVVVIGILGGFYGGWRYSQSKVGATTPAAAVASLPAAAAAAAAASPPPRPPQEARPRGMTRLIWMIVAVILGLTGYDLLVRDLLGGIGFFVAGIGIGIASAVVGSYAHDALAGSRGRS